MMLIKATPNREKVFPLLFFLLFCQFGRAQNVELGVFGGVSTYSGDLSPSEFGIYFQETGLAFGAFSRFNLSKWFAIRLGANGGYLSGSDAISENPGRRLSFRSNIFEINAVGELNLVRFGNPEFFITVPHLIFGAGLFHFNPKGKLGEEWVRLQPLGTEGQGLRGYSAPYALLQANIPFGFGIKFIFMDKLTLSGEFTARKIFTDYLDDVSDTAVNFRELVEGNGELAGQFSNPSLDPNDPPDVTYRRGGQYNDWYYFVGFTASYFLKGKSVYKTKKNKEILCPRF